MKAVTLREALNDPNLLGSVLRGPSWSNWRTLLLAAMAEPISPEELQSFRAQTGRYAPPSERVDEFWGVIGRRGGKSRAIACLASYLATLVDHSAKLSPGERGVGLLIAPDQRQARILLDYVHGALEQSVMLAQLVQSRTADTIILKNGISIEVRSASFRRLRGVTTVFVIADEAAFWHSEEFSANTDTEILNAVRPSLATTGGLLAVISSPYAKRGEVWETFRRHHGSDGNSRILVARASSREMNPTLPQEIIDRALEKDRVAASAEYLAEFRSDVEAFIDYDAVIACVDLDTIERSPSRAFIYSAFIDPSGGSSDSMTLTIAHREGERIIIDAIRERRPPFSPEAAVHEFCEFLKLYGIRVVYGDRYAGLWPREQFSKRSIQYIPYTKPKSDLFRDLLPRLNAQSIVLPNNKRLIQQLAGLERRVSRGGKESIDHGPGQHDDIANAVAGASSVLPIKRVGSLVGSYTHGN